MRSEIEAGCLFLAILQNAIGFFAASNEPQFRACAEVVFVSR
jgi:hypothetical protein